MSRRTSGPRCPRSPSCPGDRRARRADRAGRPAMIPVWVLSVLVFGINFTLWGTIGFLRILDGALDRFRRVPRNAGSGAHRARRAVAAGQGDQGDRDPRLYLGPRSGELLTIEHVAVLMAAH